jgi:membrane-associated phospholipid phosphatase
MLIVSIVSAYLPDPYYILGWRIITSFGGLYFYMALILLIYFLGDPEAGYEIIVTLISSSWINLALKNFFKLPRPPNPKVEVSGYGFPSGHAQVSSTFWASITLLYERSSVFIFSLIIITVVSYSRLALNVHYPTDIIGGLVIGLLISVIFIKVIFVNAKIDQEHSHYRVLTGWIIVSLLLITYFTYIRDIYMLRFAGFLAGFSLHPYLYKKGEKIITRLVGKYIVALVISFLFYKLITENPILIFTAFFLDGLMMPLLRFRI